MTRHRKPLHAQVLVITGASSGIGLATARMAARQGARLVLAARSGTALDALCRAIEAEGGRAVAVTADVGRRADVQAVADAAVTTFGGFDTWINVAGLTIYGPLARIPDADHARLLQTNLWGTVFGSLVAVEHFRRRGGGGLINVGSVASDLAFPFQGMYAASKHAVKGFTDALRMELLQEGLPVAVTLIKPTSIDTPLPQRARNYMDREPMLPPPVYRPETVAAAVLDAAVHPRRDVVVGGAGRLLIAAKSLAPAAFDRLAPAIVALQRRGLAPRNPEGTLHAPQAAGQVRGSQPGYVMRTSAYTFAQRHPLAAAGLVGAAVLVAGLVGAERGRAGPRPDRRGTR